MPVYTRERLLLNISYIYEIHGSAIAMTPHRFSVNVTCPAVIVEEALHPTVILNYPMTRQYVVFLSPPKKTRRVVEVRRNCRGPKVNRPGHPGKIERWDDHGILRFGR